MSYGHSARRNVRAVHYQVGVKPVPRSWRRRRVGWFGGFAATTLLVLFFGFSWSVRTVLLSTPGQVQYNDESSQPPASRQEVSKLAAPSTASAIVDLQDALDDWGSAHSGQSWGVSVKSLEGPSFSGSLNGNDNFMADGSYRLFMQLPLFKTMTLERQQQTLVTVNDSKKTISTCVDLMLRIADANCAAAVARYLNVSTANTQFKQAGLLHTSFGDTATSLKTTPNDTILLLASLNGGLLEGASQKLVQVAMKDHLFKAGLPSGCPGCTMANNASFSGDTAYDAAIVKYSHGTYVVAVFVKGGGLDDIAKVGGLIHQRILETIK